MRQVRQTRCGRVWRRGKTSALLLVAGVAAPATALGATTVALAAGTSGAGRQAARARVTHLAAAVSGHTITVTGTVVVSPDTAAARRRVRVVLELDGVDHAYERHIVSPTAKQTYSVHWNTLLIGHLRLSAHAAVGQTASKVVLRRKLVVTTPRTRTITITAPASTTGTPMLGLFKLTAGSAPLYQSPSGTYVEMLNGSGAALPNISSPSANKDFTTFSPGVDGGLSTVAYEPAPKPAFANGSSGSALANDIVQPVGFEGVNFSIETSATDAQTGHANPIPQIYDDNGKLSGQVTAWDAQWNGQSFNQGTPKPDGTSPAPTTPVTGTYDASTGAFALSWRSEIVGGPFNGYSGVWHLAGTFVPATP